MDRLDTAGALNADDKTPNKDGDTGQDENQTGKGGIPFPKPQEE